MQTQSASPSANWQGTNTSSCWCGRETEFFTPSVGRRCCAAQEFRAEQPAKRASTIQFHLHLCPARKVKNSVSHPVGAVGNGGQPRSGVVSAIRVSPRIMTFRIGAAPGPCSSAGQSSETPQSSQSRKTLGRAGSAEWEKQKLRKWK
jgi:hypothetical protein